MIRTIYILLFLFFATYLAYSQGQKVELIQAGSLEGGTYKGKQVRKLIGNVIFIQDGKLMYCDSAFQYETSSDFEAFGRVKIVQSDTQNITADHLFCRTSKIYNL